MNIVDKFKTLLNTTKELEDKLFKSIIAELIDSNNPKEIQKFIDYFNGKIYYMHNFIFLFECIYNFPYTNMKSKKINIDYNEIDKLISIYSKQEKKLQNFEKIYQKEIKWNLINSGKKLI